MNSTVIPSHNSDEITQQDIQFIQNVAKKIHDTGLVTPAVFFLEMTKPLSLLGSHFLVFFGPIINAFIRAENYYRATELMEEPENIERLIKEIEALELAEEEPITEKQA
ncbi:MAG: hypothetical protein ISR83_08775 [Candidatus Marinimicrobia bacterium]|nr:hypothetical protein [Candidatus Neomarinimicrobiota bacterium]